MIDSFGTSSLKDSAELAVVTRGGFVESRHAGSVVVLNPEGETVFSLGNPAEIIYTRSALKPIQLLTMHTLGLELANDKERAIALASHDGSHAHAEIVWRILAAGNLETDDLLCPDSWPMGSRAARKHAASGGVPKRILHCCSGKHAAMLRTCQVNGWATENYTDFDHPLQLAIKETVQRFTGEIPHISIDGCGAPTHAVSLTGLARAIRRMATSEANSPFPLQRMANNLLRAARVNGWVVSGEDTGDTVLMDQLGVFSKQGAEGSVVVATTDGYVTAVRILDGSSRALHIVAIEALRQAGGLSDEAVASVKEHLKLNIYGGGSVVGSICPAF